MENKAPYISVVIPTYNRAAYIGEAIDSVLAQKKIKCPYEIIVVDDGSTDDTEKIVKKIKGPIRYFKIRHSGLPSVARNFGVAKAKGELIAFQDSDDLWPDNKLAKQISVFDDAKVIMAYGQAEIMDDKGKLSHRKLVKSNRLKNGERFNSLLKENVISTLTVIVRKSAIDTIGAFNEDESLRAVEDYELWLRLAAKNPGRIVCINETLASYRVHDQNISSANSILAIERLLSVYNQIWQVNYLTKSQRLALEKQLALMHENWSRQKNIEENPPMISVVMSMYNSEKYLREAVDSILAQRYMDFEFIIINDGCNDKSVDIVNSYKDPRIRLIQQTNHGLVYSFNKGVKLARAKYIARMDSDDVSLPTRFKKEIEWLEAKPNRGLVGSYFSYVDKKTKHTDVVMVWPTKHTDILRTMYFVNPYGHGTVIMRREAVIGVGGYRSEYEPAEDYDLWTRIAEHWEIGEIPEVLYLWRLHYKNVSHTESAVQNKSAGKIIGNLWSRQPVDKSFLRILIDARYYKNLNSKYSQRVAREYADNQSRLAAEFLAHGKLIIGYKTALAALILNPRLALSYWETFLRAPIRKIRGK